MTYLFYFFVGKFPKFFNFSDSMEKIYLVELNIFKENAFYGLQKIPLDNFPRNFYIWSAIVNGVCMQKIKIGHRANFRAKHKCFPQILFPVRAILRSINFRCADFKTDSADACILVMACVVCFARVQLKTLSSLLKEFFSFYDVWKPNALCASMWVWKAVFKLQLLLHFPFFFY